MKLNSINTATPRQQADADKWIKNTAKRLYNELVTAGHEVTEKQIDRIGEFIDRHVEPVNEYLIERLTLGEIGQQFTRTLNTWFNFDPQNKTQLND
jgi:hypothetical protein